MLQLFKRQFVRVNSEAAGNDRIFFRVKAEDETFVGEISQHEQVLLFREISWQRTVWKKKRAREHKLGLPFFVFEFQVKVFDARHGRT